MRNLTMIISLVVMLISCSSGGAASGGGVESGVAGDPATEETTGDVPVFDTDSAYSYVSRQVAFGPRVPNSEAHERAAKWLAGELGRHGAKVTLQQAEVRTHDGTPLRMTNIMGSYNPEQGDRLLLLAHYDTRPWADKDKDSSKHKTPIDGANDGGSGVGVLLETARNLGNYNPGKGIDILFVDAEDSGVEDDDDSWALGARYFAENPIVPGYRPAQVILLDMVGGKEAVFPSEYFSRRSASTLDDSFRRAAAREGYSHIFPSSIGGAVNDDHIPFLEQGIPAIDIIDYRPTGFCPTWHTLDDNMENIEPATLTAVGRTLLRYIYEE